ncbi:hypothetical protein GK047_13210 [Paenibacillus sp. SYP-B3998]|uniref:Uncharacterized protein n=1 Tax=Paenibacillus sp. SYP-B3998 TaxID=2678564 RepID=A0A6G3ZXL9_9BACL|nr:hypothetical protein [Paenibacillus sp. SYP-B3998]NEW06963.1 hypothetical protein [Paenibacillus sp. SYP-B3998]
MVTIKQGQLPTSPQIFPGCPRKQRITIQQRLRPLIGTLGDITLLNGKAFGGTIRSVGSTSFVVSVNKKNVAINYNNLASFRIEVNPQRVNFKAVVRTKTLGILNAINIRIGSNFVEIISVVPENDPDVIFFFRHIIPFNEIIAIACNEIKKCSCRRSSK